MTTADTKVPAPASQTPGSMSASSAPRRARPAPQTGQRLSRLWLLTPVLIIGLSLGGWGLWLRMTGTAAGGDVRLHTIVRRSFPIVLKEKGELKAHKSVDIKCEVEGRSTIIWLIPEGTTVKEGDLLVELSAENIDQRIREKEVSVNTARNTHETAMAELDIQLNQNASDILKAQTARDLARIDLEKWEKGDRAQQLEDAELALESANSRHDQATEQFRVSQRMYEQNFVTKVELEQDELDLQEAEFALRKAKRALGVLEAYTFQKDYMTYKSALEDAEESLKRTQATAKVEEAKARNTADRAKEQLALVEAELKKYQEQLAKTKIRAPQAGLVVYHSDRYRRSNTVIDVGGEVHQNQTILELPDLSQMKLVIRIHEADAERIKVGLPAKIQVAGVYEELAADTGNGTRASGAQKVFDGHVTKIASLADTRNRWLNPELREFETEIMLTETSEALKPGVTAESEIYVDHIEDALAVPVQAIYSRAGYSYLFLGENGGRPEYREVKLGASSTSFVQVLSGVTEGDRIWTTIDDEMIALLPSVDKEDVSAQRQLEAARQALGNTRANGNGDGARPRGPAAGREAASAPGNRGGGQGGDRAQQPPRAGPSPSPRPNPPAAGSGGKAGNAPAG